MSVVDMFIFLVTHFFCFGFCGAALGSLGFVVALPLSAFLAYLFSIWSISYASFLFTWTADHALRAVAFKEFLKTAFDHLGMLFL